MAKIVPFPDKDDKGEAKDAVLLMESMLQYFKDGESDRFIIASKGHDGTVMVGNINCDYGELMELIGHLQAYVLELAMFGSEADQY